VPPILLDNDCEGRPQTITFKYNGGPCGQSKNFQSRQKFTCTDSAVPPPTAVGTLNYIEAVPRGGGDQYFAGNVAVGTQYTLNENLEFDKLSADMTITVFESQGGALLQTVDVHLSCSQALFLFDKFGANQVVKWVETDGRVVSAEASGITTDSFKIELESGDVVKPVRLLEMQVLTNAQEAPIDYTDNVKGKILRPGDSIELPGFPIDIDLTQRIKYTFFTTIIGETEDGTNMCNGNDFHECTIGFNLSPVFPTDVPTPRPTLTAFPTGPAETTPCEIASNIECTVIQPSNPLVPLSCDDLSGDASRTCPASTELLAAFLVYDGTFGPSVFVNPVCGKNEFFGRFVNAGEFVEINTRAKDFCEGVLTINLYDADPLQGGKLLGSGDAAIACPGPWTIGNTIAPGLTLAYYANTIDNGLTFTYNFAEAEVQIDYVAYNAGRTPLVGVGGSYSGSSPFTSGEISPFGSIGARGQQVLKSDTQKVQLEGKAGTNLDFLLEASAQSDNDFALSCATTVSYSIEL